MTGITCMLVGAKSSGSGFLDTQTVTAGVVGGVGERTWGYISGSLGSISDGTSNIYGGAAILGIYYDQLSGESYLTIAGTRANSGWTSMACVQSGATLNRASASYTTVGGITTWTWNGIIFTGTGTKTINFS